MMSETVVTVDGSTNNTNNPRQGPTVKTDPGQPRLVGGLALNVPYFKTIPGMLKLAQLVLGIICMACASSTVHGPSIWFMIVAIISFIATLMWTFIYLLSIREALKYPINWILSEFVYYGIDCALYCTAFIAQLSFWCSFSRNAYVSSQIAAGVFGLFNAVAYGASVFFLWIEWKNSQTQ